MKRLLFCILAGSLFVLMTAGPSAAAEQSGFGYRSWGLRAGLSTDPDQIFVGAQLDLGEFVPDLRFKPNATIGVGDHMTLVSINPDISYAFPVEDLGKLYVGGLFAFEWRRTDVLEDVKHLAELAGTSVDDSDTDTDIGIHAIGGLEFQTYPVFVELNIGLSDEVPDLKASVGYNFE